MVARQQYDRSQGYRSGFERKFHDKHPDFEYETYRFTYTLEHHYTPDFYDPSCDVFYETKGKWEPNDRTKLLAVLRQNPHIKIVMVFQNPNLRLSPLSKTTYADWCDKHGVEWRRL